MSRSRVASREVLGWSTPPTVPKLNVDEGRHFYDADEETRAWIACFNELDIELYKRILQNSPLMGRSSPRTLCIDQTKLSRLGGPPKGTASDKGRGRHPLLKRAVRRTLGWGCSSARAKWAGSSRERRRPGTVHAKHSAG
jgi:hypothetical protein